MKNFLLVLITNILFQTCFGQVTYSIKNYFFPDSGNNEVSFYNSTVKEISRRIFYNHNNTCYEDAHFMEDNVTSTATFIVTITEDEVKVKSVNIWSVLTIQNQQYNYSSNILLKMPPIGQTVSWIYQEGTEKRKCIANWTSVNYNGKQLRAIKVVKFYQKFNAKAIEYYVKGIGLWKTDFMEQGKEMKNFEKFNSLNYDQIDQIQNHFDEDKIQSTIATENNINKIRQNFTDIPSNSSKRLSKEVLIELTNNIVAVKANDQYLTAELFGLFTKGDIEQTENEIENIDNSIEAQRLLFNYWYYDKFSPFSDRYSAMLVYFEDDLLMTENNAKILANYINQLDYLNALEKTNNISVVNNRISINNERKGGTDSVIFVPNIPPFKVVRGDRIIRSYPSLLKKKLDQATINVIIKISPEGKGIFMSFDRGSSSTSVAYANAISEYLKNVYFDTSNHESIAVLQFNFNTNKPENN